MYGLDPHQGRIGVCIVGVGEEVWLFRKLPFWMREVMLDKTIKKIFFNAKFDLQWIIKELGITQAFNIQDLYLKELLVASQLRRGPGRVKHDLASTLRRRLGVEIEKSIKHEETDWTGPLSPEMEAYCLEDAVYMSTLNRTLDDELRSTGQTRAAEIENNAVFAVAQMSLNGIGIDQAGWAKAIIDWQESAKNIFEVLQPMFPTVLNFNSVPQLMRAAPDVLGVDLPNTRKETLKAYAAHSEPIATLLKYRHFQKLLSSWGEDYLRDYVHPLTGRIHPSWWQLGTGTGRFSCSRPNLQQIPRDPYFRRLFVARPGHVLISADYKAIEVLVSAVLSSDIALLQACAEGDVHSAVARDVLGVSDVSKPQRQLAKAIVFGLLFGGGAVGLMNYAKTSYDVLMEEDEARLYVAKFFSAYPGMAARRRWAYDQFRKDGQGVVVATNMVGMRRVLAGEDYKPTTLLNTTVQSTAGYGIKAALNRLTMNDFSQYICLQVHDEIVSEVPEDEADEAALYIEACMKQGMREVIGDMPVGVDIHIGKTWAEE